MSPVANANLAFVGLKVALVSRDPATRLAGAKAFERAPDDWVIELCEVTPPDADVVVCGPDVPDCSGLPFDPTQPGALLELIAAKTRERATIAVAGACGGCGVTTIALHLARRYASCLVELGARAGLAERLALGRGGLKTWDPEDETEPFELAALPMSDGFRAAFAPAGEVTGAERVIELSTQHFEPVVVDVPSGAQVPDRCDALVVVMPATVPGARRTRSWLDGVGDVGIRAVVSNRVGGGGDTTRVGLQRALGDRITLELPHCPGMRDAEDDGALLSRRHRWARRLDALAVQIRARVSSPS